MTQAMQQLLSAANPATLALAMNADEVNATLDYLMQNPQLSTAYRTRVIWQALQARNQELRA